MIIIPKKRYFSTLRNFLKERVSKFFLIKKYLQYFNIQGIPKVLNFEVVNNYILFTLP